MTDVAPEPIQPSGPAIRVVAQFVRDLSFENPRAPESLRSTEGAPSMEMGVEMAARGRPDGLFEVDIKISCTAKQGEATAFQVELLYGGLFEITNVSEEMVEPILLVECPRFMFPFVRKIIADAVVDGGFPPFLMEPMDFGAIYQAQLAQREADQTPGGVVLQ